MFNRRPTAARPERTWQPTKSFWIVAALVLLLVIASAKSSGFGGIILILGLVALITGLYALFTKRNTWVSLPHRKSAGMMAGAGIVALFVGGGVVGATAAPSAPVVNKSALVAVEQSATPTPTPTPTATNPSGDDCVTANETQTYSDELFICTMGTDKALVWMTESESKQTVKAAADKAAAEKAAAKKLAAEKAAAKKLAAEKKAAAEKLAAEKKAAAQKLAAEKAAEKKAAAEQAAAQQAAAEEAARQAAAVPAAPSGPVGGYVHPGSFCSGGTGFSKTGRPMVCAPASDGRMRWIGA